VLIGSFEEAGGRWRARAAGSTGARHEDPAVAGGWALAAAKCCTRAALSMELFRDYGAVERSPGGGVTEEEKQ
jgi:hypothetical protein